MEEEVVPNHRNSPAATKKEALWTIGDLMGDRPQARWSQRVHVLTSDGSDMIYPLISDTFVRRYGGKLN